MFLRGVLGVMLGVVDAASSSFRFVEPKRAPMYSELMPFFTPINVKVMPVCVLLESWAMTDLESGLGELNPSDKDFNDPKLFPISTLDPNEMVGCTLLTRVLQVGRITPDPVVEMVWGRITKARPSPGKAFVPMVELSAPAKGVIPLRARIGKRRVFRESKLKWKIENIELDGEFSDSQMDLIRESGIGDANRDFLVWYSPEAPSQGEPFNRTKGAQTMDAIGMAFVPSYIPKEIFMWDGLDLLGWGRFNLDEFIGPRDWRGRKNYEILLSMVKKDEERIRSLTADDYLRSFYKFCRFMFCDLFEFEFCERCVILYQNLRNTLQKDLPKDMWMLLLVRDWHKLFVKMLKHLGPGGEGVEKMLAESKAMTEVKHRERDGFPERVIELANDAHRELLKSKEWRTRKREPNCVLC